MSNKFRFAFSKPGLIIGGVIGLFGSFAMYGKYMSYKAKIHPTREIAEAALKLDKRISNYCGKNYKIKKYEWVNENDDSVRYRIRLEGIRGKCKVLIKCDKVRHGELRRISEEQKEYEKKSKEEKAISTFKPFNFNDVLIPTPSTMKKMESEGVDKEIAEEDTFYALSSVVMVANDSLVFNIRPIGPKYRDYDIESTKYSYKSYSDIQNSLSSIKQKYQEMLSSDISTEDFRNEILLAKQTKYQDMIKTRKFIMIGNCILVTMLVFSYKFISKNTIDVTTLKSLQNKIMQMNKNTSNGYKKLLCISYQYKFLQKAFLIEGLIVDDKCNLSRLETMTEDGSTQPHKEVKIMPMPVNMVKLAQ